MNDRLLRILSEREDFRIQGAEKKALEFFSEYLDHGSLFLVGFEPSEDPEFMFTNDAQRYRFRLSQIVRLVAEMKAGNALDWEGLSFEYINKGGLEA